MICVDHIISTSLLPILPPPSSALPSYQLDFFPVPLSVSQKNTCKQKNKLNVRKPIKLF